VVVERRAVLVHERCSSVRRGKEQGKQEDVEETERAENQQETGWKERRRNRKQKMTNERNR
jgi:hypothetical protein